MAAIGAFTVQSGGGFAGAIHTLAIPSRPSRSARSAKGPGGESLDLPCSPTRPARRGLEKTRRNKNDYLSVKLDAPSFGAAINVALVVIDNVHTLVWSRSNGPKED